MHTLVQPCYRPTMLGSMGLTPNDRFLAQVYLMPRVEEGGAPYLACVAPHATASAADDMVYNLASACKRPGRASYLGNSKVDFCRCFIFPRTAKLYVSSRHTPRVNAHSVVLARVLNTPLLKL